ncbi:hypothetical protein RSOLAG1IB_10603 [Rhizoctonia solani AG-1 IB]|uniref:Uncharacterized protein n=1 Tax=Thanatephorus cucumeris (strain AG1-IB / isolate 7/3/14) TaxID=1108050 RepID=A0A0B7G370_THACB|nr:hypothetical protein RSOLAG1IB_10603 [Rhizoctonia solani AG-1 IB]
MSLATSLVAIGSISSRWPSDRLDQLSGFLPRPSPSDRDPTQTYATCIHGSRTLCLFLLSLDDALDLLHARPAQDQEQTRTNGKSQTWLDVDGNTQSSQTMPENIDLEYKLRERLHVRRKSFPSVHPQLNVCSSVNMQLCCSRHFNWC